MKRNNEWTRGPCGAAGYYLNPGDPAEEIGAVVNTAVGAKAAVDGVLSPEQELTVAEFGAAGVGVVLLGAALTARTAPRSHSRSHADSTHTHTHTHTHKHTRTHTRTHTRMLWKPFTQIPCFHLSLSPPLSM